MVGTDRHCKAVMAKFITRQNNKNSKRQQETKVEIQRYRQK